MKLIIFDLDQTLVDFISIHDQATREFFQRHFGVDAKLSEIDFAGRSLIDNFADLATLRGIAGDEIRKRSQELLDSYEQVFGELVPEEAEDFILPGAKELLEELSKTDNLIVLYTGGSPGIVKHVFRVTGLGKYFRFAVYGAEAESRPGMIQLAIEKAERITGKKFKDKDIVIIGDSVRDIDSGKEFNALTIAVTTGFHTAKELARHQPDFIFRSLKNYRKVKEAIGWQNS